MTTTIRAAAPSDFVGVVRLLEAAELPTAGLEPSLPDFLVAEEGGRVLGAVGLEVYGDCALLRSAVVEAGRRGSGLGIDLVESLLRHAETRGLREIYLLTTTAEHFFPRFGFAEDSPRRRRGCRAGVRRIPRRLPGFRDRDATGSGGRLTAVFRVLFLCTGNSARSQIAEALLNHDGAGRFEAESAGTVPAAQGQPGCGGGACGGRASPGTAIRREAVDGLERRSWDLVVTVCDDAKESCPIFPAGPIIAHWGMPDPAAVQGDTATKRAAFRSALDVLRRRIGTLVGLPVEELARPTLEARVREIGRVE